MFTEREEHEKTRKFYFTVKVKCAMMIYERGEVYPYGGKTVELATRDFNRIVSFMKMHYGVDLSAKSTMIVGRLENKLGRLGIESYTELMDKVEANPNGEVAHFLINTLTTNHTYFMRESLHFDFMREHALPQIKEKCANTRDVRIWSAASSSGEEAYSIVMTLKDFFGYDAARWDTKVLATDISTKVLEAAKEGIYKADQVDSLPDRWIRQYFTKLGDDRFQVRPEIRSEVIFNTFNLMDAFPWRKQFHIIFLRNVMIYFDEDTKRNLIAKMVKFLEPGGYLFIGTTETIDKTTPGLEHVSPSIYRKVGR